MNKNILYDIQQCNKSFVFLVANGSVFNIKTSSILGYCGKKDTPLYMFTNIKGFESIQLCKTKSNIGKLVECLAYER